MKKNYRLIISISFMSIACFLFIFTLINHVNELKEIKSKDVIAEFDKLINDTENYVTDIKYDDDFRTVDIFVDREKTPEQLSDFDNVILSVMGSAMAYQIYTIEGQSVTINVIYSDNSETFKTVSFPIIIE